MNIHEYQAKQLLEQFGVSIPRGSLVQSVDEAETAAKELGGTAWVVKAQVHAGDRFKAGGIKQANSIDEVTTHTSNLLGKKLVTSQTSKEGQTVRSILVEENCEITKEYYLALLIDRNSGKINFVASTEGGENIEVALQESPEKIIKVAIDPVAGYSRFVGRRLAYGLGMKGELVKSASKTFEAMYKLFTQHDCKMLEVNPLIIDKEGKLVALDAKVDFDECALFRQPEIEKLRDTTEETLLESQAREEGLHYVSLDGDIGCLVNGAGLAMATMDIIKSVGGNPANFLDVGGSSTVDMVEKAFAIILKDDKVKAILVNIFGGIVQCDLIAKGIVAAAEQHGINVPLVVRLEGTHVALGKKILKEASFDVSFADDLADAAIKIGKLKASSTEEG